ncbi:unnamed protein product [Symbiodinium sp. CCMP2592]|nr:unnamed protein product [Symbiodinium sp. CCMP2592]
MGSRRRTRWRCKLTAALCCSRRSTWSSRRSATWAPLPLRLFGFLRKRKFSLLLRVELPEWAGVGNAGCQSVKIRRINALLFVACLVQDFESEQRTCVA